MGKKMNSSADDCLEFPSCMIATFSRKDLMGTHAIVISISLFPCQVHPGQGSHRGSHKNPEISTLVWKECWNGDLSRLQCCNDAYTPPPRRGSTLSVKGEVVLSTLALWSQCHCFRFPCLNFPFECMCLIYNSYPQIVNAKQNQLHWRDRARETERAQ